MRTCNYVAAVGEMPRCSEAYTASLGRATLPMLIFAPRADVNGEVANLL